MPGWSDLQSKLLGADRRVLAAAGATAALCLIAVALGVVRSTPAAPEPVRLADPPALQPAAPSAWEAVDARSAAAFSASSPLDAGVVGSLPAGNADGMDAAGVEPETLDCIIEPAETVEIRSPVVGRIDSLHVERADSVEVGQVLVELESGAERAAVELAEARARQTGTLDARKTSLDLSRRRRDRAEKLYGKQVLSLDNREEMESEARLAELELQQAREAQRLAEVEYRHSKELLGRRVIRSPVRGVVVERAMSVGEVVDEETILTLAQLDPLRVEVVLPAARFGSVKPGMRAAVVPELQADEVLVASVKLVDRVIDAASGTFRAQLELPNPDQAIPGGLHCQVRFLPE